MKLDLGCGQKPIEGYVGVDLPVDELVPSSSTGPFQPSIDSDGIVRFDLSSGIPWPFRDESIDGLCSSHMIEHLPSGRIDIYQWAERELGHFLQCIGTQDALFWFLDEACRVTKPGGEFLLRWPALRDPRTGEIQTAVFIDPTHQRFIPIEQALYWNRAGRAALGVSQYRARCNWVTEQHLFRQLGEGALSVVEAELLLVKEP